MGEKMGECNNGGRRGFSFQRLKLSLPAVIIGAAVLIISLQSVGQVVGQSPVGEPQQKQEQKPEQKPGQGKTPEPEEETIVIKSNLIAVPVSVTNASGEPVRNLKLEDFQLEEEGQVQQIQNLGEPGKTPIELALLFDVSRSVRNRFDFERESAGQFLKQVMKPGDSVTVFTIGSGPKIAVERTENAEKAIKSTMSIEPSEDSTAFFDTVVKAARYLNDRADPGIRRVMVVISDGEDTNSERFRLTDALREIQRGNSLFYSINPSGPSIRLNKISLKGNQGMVSLADQTGGVAFLPDRIEDLNRVFAQILAELQAQYLLGYYSSNERTDGAFRKIAVKVPKRAELRIRARDGYYAPKQ
ncbi:MAG: VWA domain-containing protein [Blastocatellia bacterium]|nr:VWA domain-containing protein [Blastocatellia bacterium]